MILKPSFPLLGFLGIAVFFALFGGMFAVVGSPQIALADHCEPDSLGCPDEEEGSGHICYVYEATKECSGTDYVPKSTLVPVLETFPVNISFTAVEGGPATAPRNLTVSNTNTSAGAHPMNWEIRERDTGVFPGWLEIPPPLTSPPPIAGGGSITKSIRANPAGLPAGDYSAVIRVIGTDSVIGEPASPDHTDISVLFTVEGADFAFNVSVNPSAGVSPLDNVKITADWLGSAMGTVSNISLDCNGDGTLEMSGESTDADPYELPTTCNYPSFGNYTVTVRATRGGTTAEGSAIVEVASPATFTVSKLSPETATEGISQVFQATVSVGAGSAPVGSCSLWIEGAFAGEMKNGDPDTGLVFAADKCDPGTTCTARYRSTFSAAGNYNNSYARCTSSEAAKAGLPVTIVVTGAGREGTAVSDSDDSGAELLPITVKFPNPLGYDTFSGLVNALINFLFTLAVIGAPVLLVIAGVIFMTAAGDPSRVATARRMLLWTIIGFGIILISKGLVEVLKAILGI